MFVMVAAFLFFALLNETIREYRKNVLCTFFMKLWLIALQPPYFVAKETRKRDVSRLFRVNGQSSMVRRTFSEPCSARQP